MRKLTGMMMLVVAALFFSCTDKVSDESGSGFEGSDSYVYMNVSVALPSASATRSATDSIVGDKGGTTNSDADVDFDFDFENAYDYENKVSQMLLVLASTENEYITSAVLQGDIVPAPTTNQSYGFTKGNRFSRSEIVAAYKDDRIKPVTTETGITYPVRVYVFCNPQEDLLNTFENISAKDKTWLDKTQTASENNDVIWSQNHFLMSNAKIKEVNLPKEEDWSYYTTEQSPFHLSTPAEPVYVERAVARLDFKNASQYKNDDSGAICRYDVKTPDGKNALSVNLTHMKLVNMSKEYYYLRRVSGDGTNKNWTAGGIEGPNNYVVDTDWAKKNRIYEIDAANNTLGVNDYYNTTNAHLAFHFPLYETTTEVNNVKKQYNLTWTDTDLMTYILGEGLGDPDLWIDGNQGYNIWRYVTENTIPGKKENQKTIQSTGIVFKAEILKGADYETANFSENVRKALDGESAPILYFYNNTLFAGLQELVQGAKDEGTTSPLYRALNAVFSHWSTENDNNLYKYSEKPVEDEEKWLTVEKYLDTENPITLDENLTEGKEEYLVFKRLLTDEKIVTMYEADPEDGKYYCYYFYWNRHNDNGNNSEMGRMEFATVRNNVYKLYVGAITRLGHPTDPEDDPDPVDPNDPDEDDEVYLDVTVEVLPWVVRVNNITF